MITTMIIHSSIILLDVGCVYLWPDVRFSVEGVVWLYLQYLLLGESWVEDGSWIENEILDLLTVYW